MNTLAVHRPVDRVWMLLAVLAIPLLWAAWHVVTAPSPPVDRPAIQSTLNPNTAPWWELMVLPEIGETTARRIVGYREDHGDRSPVYRTPEDLELVPDIGPKTVQRIAPYLRFAD